MELAIPLFLGPTPNGERKVFGVVGGHLDGDYCWVVTYLSTFYITALYLHDVIFKGI